MTTCTMTFGNTEFGININKLGGQVRILKNGAPYWKGQWFPNEKALFLKNFPFEDIRKRLEKTIVANIDNNEIVFPYVNR